MKPSPKKLLIALGIAGSIFFPKPLHALNQETKNNFPEFIKNHCTPSLEYTLSLPIKEAQARYHKHINCIFNQGMQQMVATNHQEFRPHFAEAQSDQTLEDINFAGECSLEEVFATQKENGFQTQCEFAEGDSLIENPHSACRITEIVTNEFCAYQEYWAIKMEDDSGRQNRMKEESKDTNASSALQGLEGQDRHYQTEMIKSEEILWNMIRRYKEFETAHRLHLWYTLQRDHLQQTQKFLYQIRTAIQSWPSKFINAASRICDQIRYQSR